MSTNRLIAGIASVIALGLVVGLWLSRQAPKEGPPVGAPNKRDWLASNGGKRPRLETITADEKVPDSGKGFYKWLISANGGVQIDVYAEDVVFHRAYTYCYLFKYQERVKGFVVEDIEINGLPTNP